MARIVAIEPDNDWFFSLRMMLLDPDGVRVGYALADDRDSVAEISVNLTSSQLF
jgi:hypothetical protein|tara:strand:- start:35 stop:196 length:162 start_codon:yes stop_codon:yes gene_type:complete